jgi:serine/threonine-protein kinase
MLARPAEGQAARMRETLLLKPASPVPGDTPRGPSSARLSTEQLTQASGRLGIFCGVLAGAITFALALNYFFVYALGWDAPRGFAEIRNIKLTLIAISLAGFAIARSRLRPETILNLGLLYQFGGAFLVESQSYVDGTLLHDNTLLIGWVCVWIVMFPLMVPSPPAKSVVVSFASASTGPLLVLLCVLTNHEHPPLSAETLVRSFFPNYLAAAMAIVPAVLIWRLNTTVHVAQTKLRAMGSYQLVKLLGKGGMGEVWQAEHRMLARPAAIKIVSPGILEDETQGSRESMLKRFEHEARATASLHSPHTVSLYDFGTTEDGTFYYVMELLYGTDLESLVSTFGPISPARTVHILRQICDSLAEAHHAGLIHRDIKPANIYLCRLGIAHDFAKVLDFGLVTKAKGCQHEQKARLTGAHTIVGTPNFMSPEMAQGQPDIDGRADLYALGCVGYWLLTGTLVFEGEKTPMQILMDHIGSKPAAPSRRTQQPIPPELEKLILLCLEKDPRNRPASAQELARLLDALPIAPRWGETEAGQWWAENLPELVAPRLETSGLASTVVHVAS